MELAQLGYSRARKNVFFLLLTHATPLCNTVSCGKERVRPAGGRVNRKGDEMKKGKTDKSTDGYAGLKRMMRESGLTTMDVAKLSGRCSRSSMSCYLSGKRDMAFHTALAIARALHVKPEELSGGKEQEALDELNAAQARLNAVQGSVSEGSDSPATHSKSVQALAARLESSLSAHSLVRFARLPPGAVLPLRTLLTIRDIPEAESTPQDVSLLKEAATLALQQIRSKRRPLPESERGPSLGEMIRRKESGMDDLTGRARA